MISVERIAEGFGPKGLARLGRALDEQTGPKRLLVQYAPHSFGLKSMNLPLCFWLQGRRTAGDEIHILFHEVAFPFVRKPLQHNLLAAAHRLMARLVLKAANRVYVTTPAWEPLLRSAGWRGECQWLPVSSNIPVADHEEAVSIRRNLLPNGRFLVGHFGTYGPGSDTCLAPAMRLLKEKSSSVRFVLLGRGGDEFFERNTDLKSFSTAAGSLEPKPLAAHLAACDVMLQPYPGGVNARRSTMMACLVNGVPTVANLGCLSESLWMDGGVALAHDDPESLAAVAAGLLADDDERSRLARAGVELYSNHFSIERVVSALMGERVGV